MRSTLITFLALVISIVSINAQCPEGPEPFFWHPDQVDSFKLIYPECEKYSWQFTMERGEYIMPKEGENLKYLVTLFIILSFILITIKVITRNIRYFN